MSEATYRYAGVPLTAAIAQSLIVELFDGQLLERRIIIDGVLNAHMQRGGAAPRADMSQVIRIALNGLRAEGAAVNVSIGHWQIGARTHHEVLETAAEPKEQLPIVDPLPSDVIELGEGPEAVYLYYLPTYRVLAERDGRKSWPCKIGRTSGDPLTRIASQAATALPEPPHMAALLWTSASVDWERAFHGVLAARNKRVINALGVEWFETSPAEFVDIATWIEPALARPSAN